MLSVFKQMRRVGLAVVALGSIGLSGTVFAQMAPPSGDTITNTATVNYTVNSVNQTPVICERVVPGRHRDQSQRNGWSHLQRDAGRTRPGGHVHGDQHQQHHLELHARRAPTRMRAPRLRHGQPRCSRRRTATTCTTPWMTPRRRSRAWRSGASRTVFVTGDVPGAAINNGCSGAPHGHRHRSGRRPGLGHRRSARTTGGCRSWLRNDDAFARRHLQHPDGDAGRDQVEPGASPTTCPSPSANPKAIPGATVEYTITIANTVRRLRPCRRSAMRCRLPPRSARMNIRARLDVEHPGGRESVAYCTSDADADGCVLAGNTLTIGTPAITLGRRELHGRRALPRHHQLTGRNRKANHSHDMECRG